MVECPHAAQHGRRLQHRAAPFGRRRRGPASLARRRDRRHHPAPGRGRQLSSAIQARRDRGQRGRRGRLLRPVAGQPQPRCGRAGPGPCDAIAAALAHDAVARQDRPRNPGLAGAGMAGAVGGRHLSGVAPARALASLGDRDARRRRFSHQLRTASRRRADSRAIPAGGGGHRVFPGPAATGPATGRQRGHGAGGCARRRAAGAGSGRTGDRLGRRRGPGARPGAGRRHPGDAAARSGARRLPGARAPRR
ncbi:Uncharacterised protein [Achromobacter xylosoxidans]|nr:Uncharacterised protein [Achromobacter xylosoxidans]